MTVTIRSLLTVGPVLVPLTTGGTVRLAPGQVSPELPDVAVTDNAKVDKLRRLGLIDVTGGDETADEPDEDAAAPPKPAARSRKRSEPSG